MKGQTVAAVVAIGAALAVVGLLGALLVQGGRTPQRDAAAVATSVATVDPTLEPSPQAVAPAPAPAPIPVPAVPQVQPPTPAPAPTAEPVATQTYRGIGDDVIRLSAPVRLAVLTFRCPACSANAVVKTDADLLVNAIGAYSGVRLMGGFDGNVTMRQVQITANAPWTVIISGVGTLKDSGSGLVSGRGDQVVRLSSAPGAVHFTHTGRANFVVRVLPPGGGAPQLPVNQIGNYAGTVVFERAGSPVVVEVTADGAWTMTPA